MTSKITVEVVDRSLAADAEAMAGRLAEERVASRLTAQDATLWGEKAQREAGIRLGWTRLPQTSRPLLPEIDALAAELRADGLSRVVLAGMGGSSLAPEVICASGRQESGPSPLVVLDTTDPGQVRDALAGGLERTVLVVSSKSGSTVETDSHRRAFEAAFARAGIDPASRIVVVTDPGTPLEAQAREAGYRRVFAADPHVGGRYSALTAFGLVPSGLAGVDVAELLDDAADAAAVLAEDTADNPALALACALAAAHARGAEKVVLAEVGGGTLGLGDWVEQLVAESTGKDGTGLLPVIVEGGDAPGFADAGTDATPVAIGGTPVRAQVCTAGPLGGLFQLWEHATAVLGRLLGINPFDQPDVEAAKKATRVLLDAPADAGPAQEPLFTSGAIEVYPYGDWLPPSVTTVDAALAALAAATPRFGYLAVQAYLNRIAEASAAALRPELARRTGLQTTFGWGPRFLHSTGQYHKGGHPNGAFLQITGAVEEDLPVPGRPYTFGRLQLAQAVGDGQVLAERGRPVLRLHLTDRAVGLAELGPAVRGPRR
ncbi:MAG TPA: glucose-6-phosphate isomerase [Pseudonocardiaceae bacterium]|jgi:glucose-6-phosphate isomerase